MHIERALDFMVSVSQSQFVYQSGYVGHYENSQVCRENPSNVKVK